VTTCRQEGFAAAHPSALVGERAGLICDGDIGLCAVGDPVSSVWKDTLQQHAILCFEGGMQLKFYQCVEPAEA